MKIEQVSPWHASLSIPPPGQVPLNTEDHRRPIVIRTGMIRDSKDADTCLWRHTLKNGFMHRRPTLDIIDMPQKSELFFSSLVYKTHSLENKLYIWRVLSY